MVLLNNTFVNEKKQLVGVPVWLAMGLTNFVLAILIMVQAYIVASEQKGKYIVFPLSRSSASVAYFLFLFASLSFFVGLSLSRGSMVSFTSAGVALLSIFIALLPSTGWVSNVTDLVNNEALLSRVALLVASFAVVTATMTSPSTYTRLLMIPFMVLVLFTAMLTETHYMVVPDLDITPSPSS